MPSNEHLAPNNNFKCHAMLPGGGTADISIVSAHRDGDEEIRELIQRRYGIVYRIVSHEQFDVLTINHSSRDFGKIIMEVKKIT